MLGDLSRWLEARLRAQVYAEEHRHDRDDDAVRVASAALLVEAARADHHFSDEERRQLLVLLREAHGLSAVDAEALLAHGHDRSGKAVSLTELTQVVIRHCSAAQRKQLLVEMWRVALADGRVDKYEEYVIRQVAGLLYVPHEDFIHARELARQAGRES